MTTAVLLTMLSLSTALQVMVAGPSEEERLRRKQWAIEKRKKEEEKARQVALRLQQEEERRREVEEARMNARRQAIRERIQKQHEIAARLASDKEEADERARQVSCFKRGPEMIACQILISLPRFYQPSLSIPSCPQARASEVSQGEAIV